jgi:hypothetical protein
MTLPAVIEGYFAEWDHLAGSALADAAERLIDARQLPAPAAELRFCSASSSRCTAGRRALPASWPADVRSAGARPGLNEK